MIIENHVCVSVDGERGTRALPVWEWDGGPGEPLSQPCPPSDARCALHALPGHLPGHAERSHPTSVSQEAKVTGIFQVPMVTVWSIAKNYALLSLILERYHKLTLSVPVTCSVTL